MRNVVTFLIVGSLFAGIAWLFLRGQSDVPAGAGPEVGQAAPELSGEDHLGQKFNLADFRGKVVVVTFWANFCPPCKAQIPHERELVQRMAGKPFLFLGVNCDPEHATMLKACKTFGINWRNLWDGPSQSYTRKYDVESLPSTFVIDHKGIIRFRDVRGEELDAAVETLLREM